MRTIIFTNSVFPCLSETFVFDQYELLEGDGVQMRIVSNNRPNTDEVHPKMRPIMGKVDYLCDAKYGEILMAHIYALVNAPVRYLSALARLIGSEEKVKTTLGHITGAALIASRYRGLGAPLIHAHFTYGAAAVAMWTKRIAGIPYVLTLHGSDLIFDAPPDLEAKLDEANGLVSISNFNVDFLRKNFPKVRTSKITVIPMGVPPAASPFLTAPIPGILRLLTVGRLSTQKAQHVLVEACALLKQRGILFSCQIVGEGPMRPSLESLIIELKLENEVHLVGARFHDEVLALYGNTDLFILCSIAEGMPIVLMEAMRAGVPLVSTSIGAIPELVQDAGLLIPQNNSFALADAVELFASGKLDIEKMKTRAKEIVAKEFDLATNHRRLEDLLESLKLNN